MLANPTPAGPQNNLPANVQPMGAIGHGNPVSAMPMPGHQQGFDIWGPLQRRKYLIALFCLIGAGLGYLYYSKSPKVYSSSTELMISTQAPPIKVDGNFQLDKVSLVKHSSLLSSELVLSNAVSSGGFASLETFKDVPNPVNALKNLIEVVSENEETLIVVCTGPSPEDLPVILSQVVDAYKNIILDDSQTIGAQTIDLVQKLAAKISDEKEGTENKWLELRKKLGITMSDENGNVANPFTKRLSYLQDQQSEYKSQLRDVQERAQALSKSLKVDETTGIIDPVMVKVVALEAQDYLKLTRSGLRDEQSRFVNNELSKLATLEQRAWSMETKITELRLERARRSDVFGSGHKSIVTLDEQIAVFEGQQAEMMTEIADLKQYIAERSPDEQINPETGESVAKTINEDSFREQERRDWITMYQFRLLQEHDRLVARLKDVNDEIEIFEKNAELVSMGIVELNMLQRQIDKKDAEINSILERLSEMNIMANNYVMTTVRTLDEPKYGLQIAPSLPKSLALGVMLAFLLGLGLAILIDQSELSYHSPHEILERLKVPVVGRIPRINTRNVEAKLGHASLIAAHKPASTAAESFRDVRTGLFFRSNVEGLKTILFTSPSPGDGKSTTVANLAISIAQAGKRVILVDADFRRPRVHQYFDEEIKPGILDVLSAELNLKDAIRSSRLQDNLFLLTTGGRPANPGELVTSEAFRELIGALRDRFDFVLVDSPPILPVSDSTTIASMVDAVYMVTRIRKGVKLTAQKAKDTLDAVGTTWMGIIVNGIDENPHYSEYGYQYGNFSYYGGLYGRYYDSNNKAYRDKITVVADSKKKPKAKT